MAARIYTIDYKSHGTWDQRCLTLIPMKGGPLEMASNHWLVSQCPTAWEVSGIGHEPTLHKLHYIALEVFIFTDELNDHHVLWHVTCARWTKLFKDIAALGRNDPVCESIDDLRELMLVIAPLLTDAQRRLQLGDVHVVDVSANPTNTFMDGLAAMPKVG